ncbi:MAG: hypothetical protein JO115_20440 [Pseudonocardiales bacterium]|nr:hypothetical protein [Pseudonocardiales bacterium]
MVTLPKCGRHASRYELPFTGVDREAEMTIIPEESNRRAAVQAIENLPRPGWIR